MSDVETTVNEDGDEIRTEKVEETDEYILYEVYLNDEKIGTNIAAKS